MPGTSYTITLIDQASATASRVRTALDGVAMASERVASAVRTEDRAYQAVARTAARYAATELKAARAADAVAKANLKSADQLGKVGSGWLSTAKSIGLGAVAFGYLAKKVYDVGRGLIESAGHAQTWERNFSRITGDHKEIEETRTLIKSLGIGLEEGEASMLALRTQFDKLNAQAFLKIFKALSLTNEEAQRFSLVLGQISGAGVLKGQDLNQVLQLPGFNRGGIAKEIASEMKIGVDEATKLLGNGKVPADVAIRAIVHAGLASHGLQPDATAPDTAEGKLSGVDRGIAESSTGIDTKLSKLDNRMLELKRTMGARLDDAGFIEDLNKLVDVLEKVSASATKAYDSIHKFGIIKGTAVTAVQAVTGPPDAKGAQKSTQTQGQADFSANLRSLFMSKEEQDKFYLELGGRSALMLDQGMADGLNGAGKAEQAVTDMAGRVSDASDTKLGIHSPSTVFAESGRYIDEGLAQGIEGDQDLAFSAAEALAAGTISEAEMLAQAGPGVNQTAMAGVGAAAGAALGSSKSGAAPTTVGPITIQIDVDGAKGADSTVEAIRHYFDTDFAAMLERQLEGSGA